MRRAFWKSTPDDEQRRRLPPTSQPFTYEIETEQHQRLIKKTLSVSSLFFSGSAKGFISSRLSFWLRFFHFYLSFSLLPVSGSWNKRARAERSLLGCVGRRGLSRASLIDKQIEIDGSALVQKYNDATRRPSLLPEIPSFYPVYIFTCRLPNCTKIQEACGLGA